MSDSLKNVFLFCSFTTALFDWMVFLQTDVQHKAIPPPGINCKNFIVQSHVDLMKEHHLIQTSKSSVPM